MSSRFWHVAEAPLRRQPGYLLSFTEAVTAAGHVASHALLAFEPCEYEADLPYLPDTRLTLLDRLRLVDGQAVARHRSVLSRDLIERLGLSKKVIEQPDFSLYRHFEQHGLNVATASEHLVARAERALLRLPADGVVVAVSRHSFAADGTAVDAVAAVYDARRYSYEARLVRQHDPGNSKTRQENDHETQAGDRIGHVGPRLGPWEHGREG